MILILNMIEINNFSQTICICDEILAFIGIGGHSLSFLFPNALTFPSNLAQCKVGDSASDFDWLDKASWKTACIFQLEENQVARVLKVNSSTCYISVN